MHSSATSCAKTTRRYRDFCREVLLYQNGFISRTTRPEQYAEAADDKGPQNGDKGPHSKARHAALSVLEITVRVLESSSPVWSFLWEYPNKTAGDVKPQRAHGLQESARPPSFGAGRPTGARS